MLLWYSHDEWLGLIFNPFSRVRAARKNRPFLVMEDTRKFAVIAMEEERRFVPEGYEIIVTGEGAINVLESLRYLSRDVHLLNVGYAGSNSFEIGESVKIGKVRLFHPSAKYEEKEYELPGNVPCYTSCDFVTEASISEPCVFDMELAFIMAMGFKNVEAVKYVSDKLSKEEFDACLKKKNPSCPENSTESIT